MVKHNNQIPNQHFKKHWHGGKNALGSYVRTWFNQPARKKRRALGEFLQPAALRHASPYKMHHAEWITVFSVDA